MYYLKKNATCDKPKPKAAILSLLPFFPWGHRTKGSRDRKDAELLFENALFYLRYLLAEKYSVFSIKI